MYYFFSRKKNYTLLISMLMLFLTILKKKNDLFSRLVKKKKNSLDHAPSYFSSLKFFNSRLSKLYPQRIITLSIFHQFNFNDDKKSYICFEKKNSKILKRKFRTKMWICRKWLKEKKKVCGQFSRFVLVELVILFSKNSFVSQKQPWLFDHETRKKTWFVCPVNSNSRNEAVVGPPRPMTNDLFTTPRPFSLSLLPALQVDKVH